MRTGSLRALLAAGLAAAAATGCASGAGTPSAQTVLTGPTRASSGSTGPATAGGAESAGTGAGGTSGSAPGTATAPGASPGASGASHSAKPGGAIPTSPGASPGSASGPGSGPGSGPVAPLAPSSGGLDPLTACVRAGADPAPVPGSTLPRRAATDVQCLVDPLDAARPAAPGTPVRFSRMTDPSTASRGLRSWILSPYTPDLATFDQAAYGVHGDQAPSMLVAIASPKRVDGVSARYPDFVDGILRAAGATDLYSPPATGEHASGYNLVITCGHETLHGRTVCVWTGTTPGIVHYPFVGVVVLLSVVPTQQAEAVSEAVLRAIT